MPKPDKQIIIDILIKGLEQGKSRAKLLAESVKKWQFSERTFDRHWKKASEQFKKNRQAIKDKLAEVDMAAAIAAHEKEIMGVRERRSILTQIARGEIPLTKPMVVDGMIELVPIVPDWMDRKQAIAELNKMDGDYAPTKVANTDKDGNDVKQFDLSKLTDDELRTLAELQRKGGVSEA